MVLESVFSRITRDILLIDDMAAEETLQVGSYQSHHISVYIYFYVLMLILPLRLLMLAYVFGVIYFLLNMPASKTNSIDAGKPILSIGIPGGAQSKRECTRDYDANT